MSSSSSATAGSSTSSASSTSSDNAASLAIITLRYAYEQQGLWQIATHHFWQRFLDQPGHNDWQPAADGVAAPSHRDALALRAWFHATVLPQWTRHARHGGIEAGSAPHDYMALLALMRERNGFEHNAPELQMAQAGLDLTMCSDWRTLRSERRRAEEDAQRRTVDLLDLTVSYELGSLEERSAGTLLSADQVRERLRERRERPTAEQSSLNDDAAFARYEVAVRQQLATVDHDTEQLSPRLVTVSLVRLVQHRSSQAVVTPLPSVDRLPFQTPVPQPVPAAIVAERRRQQLHRLLVDNNGDRLRRFLDALPSAERQHEIRYLERFVTRNQRTGGPIRFTQLQRQLWNRLPISSVTGMPRNTPARRRVGATRVGRVGIGRLRRDTTPQRRTPWAAVSSSSSSSFVPVIGRPLTPRGYLLQSPRTPTAAVSPTTNSPALVQSTRRSAEQDQSRGSWTPPTAATPLASSTPNLVQPAVGVRTRSSSMARPASRAPSLLTIPEVDTLSNTQPSTGSGSSASTGRRHPALPSSGSPSTRPGA